ncbi:MULTISPECIES: hypothetical protein [Rhodanobacteraceae]|uniref:ApeI family dehydratase n=1 Tax=Rhodanobacteraceae TaxID=1775411 RepID=UPI0008897F83|nr:MULTISPECIES: hypothetical protein [Rhodanobacteraceae]SDF17173.1 Uncharacterized membrane protein [Dyella sp. 333MFSha]SKB81851.1 Uncharacterized membrane protein [Luteibacter sp. 22Crub2.1]
MRKLSDMVLVVVGILFPFIVYFGMDHVSTPVFGLILGGLWLIRAPALLRQPGGGWMLGITLIYCTVLAFGGEERLLRWYPSLICALLFGAFGLSLKFGPPMIERIARVAEPDLPPVAIAYTRKVTWVWVGFFFLNGTASALLAGWGPLSWWTFYNGILAYSVMGALFLGEWILRQRLRRRINKAPMDAAASRLRSHPWVDGAAGGYAGKKGPGMVVALSAAGRTALLRHGRTGLLNELGQQAAGDDALSTPLVWRFVADLPDAQHVDDTLRAGLPTEPVVLGEHRDDEGVVIDLELPIDLACFAEHFPEAPVVPGVLQVGWALSFASLRLDTPTTCRGMDALKFQRLLRPGDRPQLLLRHDKERGRLQFAYRMNGEPVSSAYLRLDGAHV